MDSAAEAAQEEAYHAAAANQEAVSAVTPSAVPARRFRIPKPYVIGGAALAVLAAGAVAAYMYLYQTPEQIVGTMLDRLESVEAFEYTGQVKLTEGSEGSDFSLRSEGAVDVRDDGTPKFQGLFALAMNGTEDMDLSAEAEARSIGDTAYFRVNEVPALGVPLLESVRDQWFVIDPEAVREQTGHDIVQENEDWLTPDQQRRVKEAFRKSRALTFTKNGSGEADGTAVHRIGYQVDEEAFKTLVLELYRIVEDEEMSDDQRQELDDALEEVAFKPGDLWIGKDDYLPRKITGGLEGGRTGTLAFTLTLENYGDDVPQIAAPDGARPVSEIVGMFTDGFGAETGSNDTDGDGLDDAQESLYRTDPRRADTDGDGHTDGDEVENGYDPLGPGRLELDAQPAI